jgi:hypothetical protein
VKGKEGKGKEGRWRGGRWGKRGERGEVKER